MPLGGGLCDDTGRVEAKIPAKYQFLAANWREPGRRMQFFVELRGYCGPNLLKPELSLD